MEKITVTERKEINWSDEESISDIKTKIAELESQGFTHIDFQAFENFGAYLSIHAQKERLETDEEAKRRIEEASKRNEIQMQRELKTYQELKAKYNL